MKKILISLLAIVLVAGCTVPDLSNLLGGTQNLGISGRGLEITTFTAEPSPVYNGTTVRITMEIENQGGTTVASDKGLVYLTGSNVELDSDDDMYWRGKSGSTNPYKSLNRTMKAADVVKGTPADTARFVWTVTSPTVPAGQTRTDTFYGRTYCAYSTGLNGNVWVYRQAEVDAARASGRSLNKASFTSTAGPVSLTVRVAPDPVVWYSSGETFDLYLTVSNQASGTIYAYNKTYSTSSFTISDTEYNKVHIDLVYDDDSLNLQSTDTCEGDQELPAGKTTTLVCTFTVTEPTTFKSYPFTITANYGYFTERIATVVVQGK